MMEKNIVMMRKKAGPIFLSLMLAMGLIALVLSGCSQEKTSQTPPPPTQAKGPNPCEILDKLPADIAKPLDINYGNKAKLVGATFNRLSEKELQASYYWQPLDDLGQYNQVFVHFADVKNNLLFQNDHPFCQKRPFMEMQGKYVKETFRVSIPASAANKEGYIGIGLFAPDAKGWPRIKIESAGEIRTDNGGTRAIIENTKF